MKLKQKVVESKGCWLESPKTGCKSDSKKELKLTLKRR